jgi:hypothetical protein
MPNTALSPSEILSRRAAVKSVLASLGMEGLAPDAATASLLDEYISGMISLEQFGTAIERHVAEMGSKRGAA